MSVWDGIRKHMRSREPAMLTTREIAEQLDEDLADVRTTLCRKAREGKVARVLPAKGSLQWRLVSGDRS